MAAGTPDRQRGLLVFVVRHEVVLSASAVIARSAPAEAVSTALMVEAPYQTRRPCAPRRQSVPNNLPRSRKHTRHRTLGTSPIVPGLIGLGFS